MDEAVVCLFVCLFVFFIVRLRSVHTDFQARLKGRSAIVSGAGRGIGRAITKRLHHAGVTVYAVSNNFQDVETLKAECPKIRTVTVDLGDWDATRAAMKQLPVVDYLVNCADVFTAGSFQAMKPEEIDSMWNVNLKGAINVSQIYVQKLRASGREGSIVNLASVAGIRRSPIATGYSLLHAALIHLPKTMAVELGPHNIRVNAICTGLVEGDTLLEQLRHAGDNMGIPIDDLMAQMTPSTTKVTDVADVVNTTLFLLSDSSENITGAVVPGNRGMSAV